MENINIIDDSISGVVMFGACSWCTECSILKKKLESIESCFVNTKFYILDVSENMTVADRFGINELPVLIAFKNGKEISRWNMGIGDLTGWLKMLGW